MCNLVWNKWILWLSCYFITPDFPGITMKPSPHSIVPGFEVRTILPGRNSSVFQIKYHISSTNYTTFDWRINRAVPLSIRKSDLLVLEVKVLFLSCCIHFRMISSLKTYPGGLFHVDGRLKTGDIIVTLNYAETSQMSLKCIRYWTFHDGWWY